MAIVRPWVDEEVRAHLPELPLVASMMAHAVRARLAGTPSEQGERFLLKRITGIAVTVLAIGLAVTFQASRHSERVRDALAGLAGDGD